MTIYLTACLGDYKTPTLSGTPSRMSTDTLCYRHAYAKNDAALKAEIESRNLDCEQILQSQSPIGGSGY